MAHTIPNRKMVSSKPKQPLRLIVSEPVKPDPKTVKKPKPKSE